MTAHLGLISKRRIYGQLRQRRRFAREASGAENQWPPIEKIPVSPKKSLFLVYVAHGFRYIYGLILIPFYGRILGAEEYGKILSAMALSQLVWLAIEYGCPPMGVRDLAITRTKTEAASYISQQITARFILLPIGATIGFAGTYLSPLLVEDKSYGLYACLLGMVSSFNIGWYFHGTLQFQKQANLEVLIYTASLLMILTLVHSPADSLIILQVLLSTTLTVNLLAIAIMIAQVELKSIVNTGAWALIVSSTALFAARSLKIINSCGATYLLGLISTPLEVGLYGAAERISNVFLTALEPMGQVLLGMVTSRMRHDDQNAAYLMMSRGIHLVSLLGIASLTCIYFLGAYIVTEIMGPGFQGSIEILGLFGIYIPIAAINFSITTYVLLPLRRDVELTKAALTGSITTLLIVFIFYKNDIIGGTAFVAARIVGELVSTGILFTYLYRQKLIKRLFKRGLPWNW